MFLIEKIKNVLRPNGGGRQFPAIIDSVTSQYLTYLPKGALNDLHEQVSRIEKEEIEGILLEAGTALGGSAIVMGRAKSPGRAMHVYDVFGMIPPPSERDGADVHQRYEIIKSGKSEGIGGKGKYYGYEDDLFTKVTENFRSHGLPLKENKIHLIQGLFEDTLLIKNKIALAHIDCDWYDSVLVCLKRIEPHLASGGVLVIDDYYDWSGCRRAVDDYFGDKKEQFEFVEKTRLHILRK